jgi:hypothetical protein
MKVCRLVLSLAFILLSSTTDFVKGGRVSFMYNILLLICCYLSAGVVEISPSPVTLVCQVGNQLELTCNTTSGIDHRWEFTVFPEDVSYTAEPVSSIGMSGVPLEPLIIGTSTITFSRLSGQNVLPLISRVTVSPVSSSLNGTVVSCFDLDTNLFATTTIQIIDPQQFGKPQSHIARKGCAGV